MPKIRMMSFMDGPFVSSSSVICLASLNSTDEMTVALFSSGRIWP